MHKSEKLKSIFKYIPYDIQHWTETGKFLEVCVTLAQETDSPK